MSLDDPPDFERGARRTRSVDDVDGGRDAVAAPAAPTRARMRLGGAAATSDDPAHVVCADAERQHDLALALADLDRDRVGVFGERRGDELKHRGRRARRSSAASLSSLTSSLTSSSS